MSSSNPLLFCLAFAVIALLNSAAAAHGTQISDYQAIARQWAFVLRQKNIDDPRWAKVTLESTHKVLEALNQRRPTKTKAALLEMANVNESKCNFEEMKTMNEYWNDYSILPKAIQSYMDHHRFRQLDVCIAKFRAPVKESKKLLSQQDEVRFYQFWDRQRRGYQLEEILARVLIDEFNLPAEADSSKVSQSLQTMVDWCKSASAKLEPGAKVLTQFPEDAYVDWGKRKKTGDSLFTLVEYYRNCRYVIEEWQEAEHKLQDEMAARRKKGQRERFAKEMRKREEEEEKKRKKKEKQAMVIAGLAFLAAS